MRRMLTRKPFTKMQGLTLLETMFALAVGALVLIGATIFYLSTKQTGNANKAVSDMNSIMAAYASYVSGGNDLTSESGKDMTSKLEDAGFLPTDLLTPWGMPYLSVPTATAGATATTVEITIQGIGGAGQAESGTSGDPGYKPEVDADKNCAAIAALVGTSAVNTGTATTCAFKYNL